MSGPSKYFFPLLIICCMSCNPYAELEEFEKNLLLQFPYQDYIQPWDRTDSLRYYPVQDLQTKSKRVKAFQVEFSGIQPTDRWADGKKIMHQQLQDYLRKLESHFSSFQTDPSIYNIGGHLVQVLHEASLNPEEKSRRCLLPLESASYYYRNAQECIKKPGADRVHLAIQKQLAGIQFMEKDFRDSLQSWNLSAGQLQRFDKALYIAKLSCKDYIAFCNSLVFEQKESGLFSKD